MDIKGIDKGRRQGSGLMPELFKTWKVAVRLREKTFDAEQRVCFTTFFISITL